MDFKVILIIAGAWSLGMVYLYGVWRIMLLYGKRNSGKVHFHTDIYRKKLCDVLSRLN